MSKKPLQPTEVFVKINEQSSLAEDKLHLNIDVVAFSDNKPVPHQAVIIEFENQKKHMTTSENGILKGADLIFTCIEGVRAKLRGWAKGSENVVCELEVIASEYEATLKQKLQQELAGKEEELRRQQDQLKSKLDEFERNKAHKESVKQKLANSVLIIGEGETVTLEKDVYEIRNDVLVEEGGTLIIQPGTVMGFSYGSGILCRGTLKAIGTAGERITFKSIGRGSGPWRNITLSGSGAEKSYLKYCFITESQGRGCVQEGNLVFVQDTGDMLMGGGLALLYVNNVFIENIEVQNCGQFPGYGINVQPCRGGGIYVKSANVFISKSTLKKNKALKGGGMCIEDANPRIEKTTISENYVADHRDDKHEACGGGLYLVNSNPILDDVVIAGNSAYKGSYGGIALIQGSKLDTSKCKIGGNIERQQ